MDINANKHIKLFIDDSDDMEKMAKCCYALASTDRIRILKGIMYYPKSISTLSNETGIPISTVSRYAQDLAEAGLISITYQPGIKGHTKFCAQETLSCNFVFDAQLFSRPDYGQREFVTEMPIGMFSSCTVTPPCGMLGAVEPLAIKDNPAAFFSPQRMNAECIWFNTGMLGYTFPVPAEFMHERTMQSLSFSFEVCSEANNYNVNWPSDITVLINGVDPKEAIEHSVVEGLDMLTARKELSGAEVELVNAMARETVLKRELDTLRDSYDYIFIDCPPSLGLLTINALTAADTLLAPIQCEYFALEGLSDLMNTVKLVKQRLNTDLQVEGVVLTMFDARTNLSGQVVNEVKKFFKNKVYDTIIPRSVRLSEAPSFGLPITLYDPRCSGARAYKALANELIGKEN